MQTLINEAIREAKALRKKLNCGNGPINLEKTLEHLDITLRYADLEDDEGFAFISDCGNRYIVINKYKINTRQNFTIAHEIGHIVLGHLDDYMQMLFDAFALERQANTFAAELLMPAEALEIYSHYPDWQVARYYGISNQALRIRQSEVFGISFR